MQKMLQEKQEATPSFESKNAEYQELAIKTRAEGGRESDLNPYLQYFVQNPTGSDTGPHQERQEMIQKQITDDPFLSVFQQALIQS
ncbi:hypothetical protein STIP28_60 [Synechococcus T7-like virus S-TIP28]|uniref:Uncharacterized protein n=1 Tax=Synechococcus T7-like virus S-TIP28 TaxID=1332140 RepID=A0AAE8XFL5_9CAUD|nr:hypothetical protein STIP28_60 [Synechococcus T7-like virus S-TIP28]